MDRQEWDSVHGDVLRTLARYLPVGMEGVAAAQARGVEAVLVRDRATRTAVAEETRPSLREVRDMVLEHRPDGRRSSLSPPRCPVCRRSPGSGDGQVWPCRVWSAGVALGVVNDEDAPSRR